MKKTLSSLLCMAIVMSAGTASALAAADCYPAYCGSSVSIVDALKCIGVDSSKENRAKIAIANGIADFSGTPAQNTYMLTLLKRGELRLATAPALQTTAAPTSVSSMSASAAPSPGCYAAYTGNSISIVDALKCLGIDSSYANCKKIAEKNGITCYRGTAYQNALMLDLLKKGQLKQVD